MAQYVMQHIVDERGLSRQFEIDSAATSREEIGAGVHRGTRKKLAEKNIACGDHRARQMTRADYDHYDLIIGMDSENMWGMKRIAGGDPEDKLHLLLDWSSHPRGIADPWYTGDFDTTFDDVWEGCTTLLNSLS